MVYGVKLGALLREDGALGDEGLQVPRGFECSVVGPRAPCTKEKREVRDYGDELEGSSERGDGGPDEAAVPMSWGAFLKQGVQARQWRGTR